MKSIVMVVLFLVMPACFAQDIPSMQITLDGKVVASLKQAMKQAKDGSIIRLGPGIYKDGGWLKANYVTIQGSKGTHLKGFTVKGKGTLVISGNDTEISDIECSEANVKDGNGACIRLQGRNLQLRNVYFHDSQQGILSGKKTGLLMIENSKFERLGRKGRSHGIYIGSGELYINNSEFLSSKDQGHEIKSRASKTIIHNSVIASLNGRDSRLIDVPNGGILEVINCTLQQGNKTSNWDLIGYGLEGVKHKKNSIKLKKNVFVLDRTNGSKVMHVKGKLEHNIVENNVIIGKYTKNKFDGSNLIFDNRDEAGLGPYPALPKR